MAGPSEKRSGTFSKRQVVKVFKYATSNLAGRRCRPGQARPGFHQGDFVTLPRRNKSCSSCIKFVGSAVKLLVYAATLLINREEAEGMANGKTPGYSRCSRLRQPLPSPPPSPARCPVVNRRGKSCPRTRLARRVLPPPLFSLFSPSAKHSTTFPVPSSFRKKFKSRV